MNPRRHGAYSPEDDRLGRAFDRRLMLRLLAQAFPYRGWMATSVALLLTTTALGLAGPFIVKWAIDHPLREAISGAGAAGASAAGSGAARGLWMAVGIYLAVAAAALLLRTLQGVAMSTVGQRVMHDLRVKVFRHLQRMPIAFYDRNPVGRLTTRVTNDIEALNQLFSSGVVTFIADLLILAGITAALIWVDRSLALTTLMVLPPLALVTAVFRRFAQRYYREQRGHLAHLNGFSQESLQGLTVIQLFRKEREMSRRYRAINDRYLTAFQRTVFCYSLYFPAVEVVGAGALAAILWRGGVGLRAGELTFGEFYLFWHYLGKFLTPIRDMAERYNVLQSAMAAAERIFKVLDTPPAEREMPSAGAGAGQEDGTGTGSGKEGGGGAVPEGPRSGVRMLRGEVEFQDVWFGYDAASPEAAWAVRGVSFRAEPGETLAIVGATGAGKSTLVNLLLRFYEPQRGRILIDGRDLREYPVHELRRRIGLVLQDGFLFSRSVEENLRFGRPDLSAEDAAAAARRTNADRVIARLPQGPATLLGERGAGLSSGEKQLLAFARALACDPDVLVLDEATAHVDAATEALIRDGLRELLHGRTSLVIAHRLSTAREADRILVMHKGEARELGTHRDLLSRRGIYHRLYRLQLEPEGDGPAPWPRDLDGKEKEADETTPSRR